MLKEFKSLFSGNSLFVMAGKLIQLVVAFATVKVMTSVLEPSEYGKVAILTAIVSFVALFLISPIGNYVTRNVTVWNERKLLGPAFKVFYKYVLIVSLLGGIIGAAVILFEFDGVLNLDQGVLLIVSLLFIGTINTTLIPLLNILGYVKGFTILNLTSAVSVLTCAYISTSLLGKNAEYWLAGLIVGQGAGVLIAVVYYAKNKQIKIEGTPNFFFDRKEVMSFALPLAISAGMFWLIFQGYRLIAANMISLLDLGLLAAGYGLAVQMMTAAESIFNTIYQAKFYQDCDSESSKVRGLAWKNLMFGVAVPMFLVCIGGVLLAPFFVKHILDQKYWGALSYYKLGIVIEYVKVLISICTLYFHQHRTTKQLIYPYLISSFVLVIAMYTLLPMFGKDVILPSILASSLVVLISLIIKIKGEKFVKFDGARDNVSP